MILDCWDTSRLYSIRLVMRDMKKFELSEDWRNLSYPFSRRKKTMLVHGYTLHIRVFSWIESSIRSVAFRFALRALVLVSLHWRNSISIKCTCNYTKEFIR